MFPSPKEEWGQCRTGRKESPWAMSKPVIGGDSRPAPTTYPTGVSPELNRAVYIDLELLFPSCSLTAALENILQAARGFCFISSEVLSGYGLQSTVKSVLLNFVSCIEELHLLGVRKTKMRPRTVHEVVYNVHTQITECSHSPLNTVILASKHHLFARAIPC